MRTNNNIIKTLRRSLFDAPNPPRFKSEYLELMDFIFPGKEMFIAFLEEENFEQQTFLAEKILLRLSYDSFFAPPTKLIFNVLKIETSIASDKKDGYIGRDHFVHVVHLYLLGIYMFFYHHILSENILVYFKNKRSKSNVKSNHLILSTIKDFVVSLRYFALFHDISYPIELLLGNHNVDKEIKIKFLDTFNEISECVSKDLSLRSLSKFISVYKLVKNDSEFSFNNLILPHISNSNKKELESISQIEFIQIEKIYGYETFRSVYSVFDKENVLAVLYEKSTNLPLLIFPPQKAGFPTKSIETEHFVKNPTLNGIKSKICAPYDKEHFQLKNYKWGFFINSEVTLGNLVESIFPTISLDEFDKAIDYIHDLTSSNYSMVVSDCSFKQYCFDIYIVLYKLAGYLNTDESNREKNGYFDFLSEIISDIGKEIPSKISNIVNKLLSEKLKGIDFESDMEDEENLEEIVLKYLSEISKTYKGFANAISVPLKSEINTQYEMKKNLEKIRVSIADYFNQKNIENNYSINIDKDYIACDNIIYKNEGYVYSIILNFNLKAKKTGLDKFDILLNYKPKYPNVPDKFYDHGVNSGIIFLSIIDIFDQLLKIEDDRNFQRLLKVAIGIDTEQDNHYVKYKFEEIFSEVFSAIVSHNLYPKFLDNTKYRTQLDNNPFSYFSILIDSLQHWDRKFQVNQAYNNMPYNTLSRSFNIEVKNNKIRISEFDERLDIQTSLKKLKHGIDDYLRKASEFIELNLAEF